MEGIKGGWWEVGFREGQANTLLDIGPSKVTNTLQSSSNNSWFGVSGVCRAPRCHPSFSLLGCCIINLPDDGAAGTAAGHATHLLGPGGCTAAAAGRGGEGRTFFFLSNCQRIHK